MKKKIIIITSIILLLLVIGILILINNIYKDKTLLAENIDYINNNYDNMKKEINNYNNVRLEVSDIINNFYFDLIEENYESNKKILDKYTLVIDNITDYTKKLDSKCDIIYSDSNVNKNCKNYKDNYEIIVNVYVNDILAYNDKINSYNIENNKKLSLYETNYNYIDYNLDNNYEEKSDNK